MKLKLSGERIMNAYNMGSWVDGLVLTFVKLTILSDEWGASRGGRYIPWDVPPIFVISRVSLLEWLLVVL